MIVNYYYLVINWIQIAVFTLSFLRVLSLGLYVLILALLPVNCRSPPSTLGVWCI